MMVGRFCGGRSPYAGELAAEVGEDGGGIG